MGSEREQSRSTAGEPAPGFGPYASLAGVTGRGDGWTATAFPWQPPSKHGHIPLPQPAAPAASPPRTAAAPEPGPRSGRRGVGACSEPTGGRSRQGPETRERGAARPPPGLARPPGPAPAHQPQGGGRHQGGAERVPGGRQPRARRRLHAGRAAGRGGARRDVGPGR